MKPVDPSATLFEIPATTNQLINSLNKLHGKINDYLAGFATVDFFAPQGEYWSPAEHVRHLTKSTRPLAKAMGFPKILLRLRFWKAKMPSRSFDVIVELYRNALEKGAQAGRYSPSQSATELPQEDWRSLIMQRWQKAGRNLTRQLQRWPETSLDQIRDPHPILGKMTVRELLYFTLYHHAHHARRVRERTSLRNLMQKAPPK